MALTHAWWRQTIVISTFDDKASLWCSVKFNTKARLRIKQEKWRNPRWCMPLSLLVAVSVCKLCILYSYIHIHMNVHIVIFIYIWMYIHTDFVCMTLYTCVLFKRLQIHLYFVFHYAVITMYSLRNIKHFPCFHTVIELSYEGKFGRTRNWSGNTILQGKCFLAFSSSFKFFVFFQVFSSFFFLVL